MHAFGARLEWNQLSSRVAIEMAARNIDLPGDAVFHSDHGSNYTSGEFAAVLERLGIRQSVGRTGICFDNSLTESFNPC